MRRLLPALALVATSVTAEAQTQRIRVGVPGYQQPLSIDSLASVIDIAAPKSETFAAATAVFEELKIPVDTRDSNAGVVGNSRIIKLRSFGGAPMSRLLNCGSGMTGPNADSWRIYITVLAFVEGKGSDKSILRVGFIAGAQDIQGASKDPVACGTTGAFEMMFADRVKKRLALT